MEYSISVESIRDKIFFLRGERVLLDRDLAALYGVKTKALKQAVRRNIKRFPDDFMFELTKEEKLNRIFKEGCDIFIDDLPEFLEASKFPENVERILFDPNERCRNENHFQKATSWAGIIKLIMGKEERF